MSAGALGTEPALSSLLGEGQMAITLTPDAGGAADARAYQGVVALSDDSLARNLEEYFANSEQLPTRLFMAFDGDQVTGLLLQRLPIADLATELTLDLRDELWAEVEMLADTIRPDELAGLALNDLLRRLFHEHTVTVHPARRLEFACTCSRERAERMLKALPKAEILELLETRGMVRHLRDLRRPLRIRPGGHPRALRAPGAAGALIPDCIVGAVSRPRTSRGPESRSGDRSHRGERPTLPRHIGVTARLHCPPSDRMPGQAPLA